MARQAIDLYKIWRHCCLEIFFLYFRLKYYNMKFWKQILLTVSLFAAIAVVTVHTSCEKNSCDGITCYNGGACGNGACHCPSGWEGAQCERLKRDRYLGVYAGYITCNNGALTIDTAFITQGNAGPTSVDVVLKSIRPKVIHGYVSSNESTYSIIVTNNDSSIAGAAYYSRMYTITLQSDRNLSIHTYESSTTGLDDTIHNACAFLGYKN